VAATNVAANGESFVMAVSSFLRIRLVASVDCEAGSGALS
jgi:hypothetical protein